MDNEKLMQIQQEIMKGLDEEKKIDEEIMNSSEEIASKLLSSNKAKAIIDNSNYTFIYRVINSKKKASATKIVDTKIIILTVANDIKYKISGNKYRPFFCTAEMDTSRNLKDNLKTVVEAFIRHKTGKMKPEYLED